MPTKWTERQTSRKVWVFLSLARKFLCSPAAPCLAPPSPAGLAAVVGAGVEPASSHHTRPSRKRLQ